MIILLDRGNNMLYLPHDIPGMETLESLYVSIWKKIQHTTKSNTQEEALNNRNRFLNDIKCDIMHDLFGMIEKDDLETMLGVKDAHKRDDIWVHLVLNRVINRHGKVLIKKIDQETKEKFMYPPDTGLNEKLVYYFNDILTNRHRCIKVPNNLIPFVERHLDTTLNNAWRAAFELKKDQHYVVGFDSLNPEAKTASEQEQKQKQIIIIDKDTGTDQSSAQWDGALHQFLQLNEGCQLTKTSLKAVFISNVSFVKRYQSLLGLTGTL